MYWFEASTYSRMVRKNAAFTKWGVNSPYITLDSKLLYY